MYLFMRNVRANQCQQSRPLC
ncbi:hypothetical protein KL86DES1_10630 [uncultured Desulfovibrio sp.]|uniref:Uncharacterized protein n=1 Tax=uncultured Desulfovibrio sp. TaxID=167968 RepID=A0A212KZP8_9BACT|nr:hypothetical protein KL86DES1_10630 [uncultured Desulfovibrio sp.]